MVRTGAAPNLGREPDRPGNRTDVRGSRAFAPSEPRSDDPWSRGGVRRGVSNIKRESLDLMEGALIRGFRPRWKRAKGKWGGIVVPKLSLDNCDLRLTIVGEAELS